MELVQATDSSSYSDGDGISKRKVSGVGDSEEEQNKFNMVTCFRNDYFSI